ncbi:MAG TPA: hypothetical protein VK581_04430 [Chthoniobacterales bacterium]|nr:hypothetical protein [Chthoniobacterales bacterium]
MINVVDLRSCLESWPYDAEKNVRIGRGIDGREIILVRQPMGLEQYEVDGRPQGGSQTVLALPPGCVSATKRIPSAMESKPRADDCATLFQEACAYYCRLIVLFRLKQWIRAERDTTQILHLLRSATQHARHREDRAQLDNWYPHIARLQVVAGAMILLEKGQYRDALQATRGIIGGLEALDTKGSDPEKFAQALLEGVRGSLANLPVFQLHEECCFLRRDDYWTIRYHGDAAFLKSTRGLQCLACLLRAPGREFHVIELLASGLEADAVVASAVMTRELRQRDGDRFPATVFNDHGPILDTRAKLEYRERLNELRQELGDAEQFNDSDRATKARDEIHAISQHLAFAVGLGGRDRKTSSEAERARCTVTKRLKQAIRKIGDAIPSLGQHLVTRIKTGYFSSYNPHPDRPVAWKF